jgi:phosphatidylglycerophosphate synthase
MFAEDLLQELRREGHTTPAFGRYIQRIVERVVRRLPSHPELVRSVAATALALFALQFAGAVLLSARIDRSAGVTYLIASSLLLLFASFWILMHLGIVQGARDERPLRRIPVPVGLTVLRFVSIPAIVLLIQRELWPIVVWVFAASAFTDVLDGVLARLSRSETRIGAVFDPLCDIAFNSAVFVSLSAAAQLPWWVTGLMLARYGLLVGGTVYLYLFHGPVRIQPTVFGKLTGVLTTVLVGLLLLGLAQWGPETRHRLKEVFDVGLGLMGLATIIQVVFIGLTNRRPFTPVLEVARPAKVVGEIRGPRR